MVYVVQSFATAAGPGGLQTAGPALHSPSFVCSVKISQNRNNVPTAKGWVLQGAVQGICMSAIFLQLKAGPGKQQVRAKAGGFGAEAVTDV